MITKNTLLTAVIAVVIAGGFLMWNNAEPNESFIEDTGNDFSIEDNTAISKPTAQTPAPGVTAKTSASKTTPLVPAVTKAPVRLLENGQFVTIITLTNSGFVPQAVSIGKGESIRFVNHSGNAMRILSATEHLGLDQEKSVGLNGVYELTFPNAGTWVFNNGKGSGFIGVVNVQ